MKNGMIDIKMQDGVSDSYFAFPKDKEKLPVVLLYMDAIGLRQRIFDMADRIAFQGYYVLAPNLFYRSKRAPVVDYATLLNAANLPELMNQVMVLARELNPEKTKRDTQDFLNYAKAQTVVDANRIGAVGYCMGGGQVLREAGEFPNEIKAAASFHAGNLATDAETSPHRWFKTIKAEVYIGHAENDRVMPPEQRTEVDRNLREAGVNFKSEVYKDCLHGWTMADVPASNPKGEELHWQRLFDLLRRNLQSF